MIERDVLRIIRAHVKERDGNGAATAKALGVSRQYLQMVLAGRRPPTHPKLLKALRLRYVETFEPM